MSEVLRKPLSRENMFLGEVISDLARLGPISVRIFTREHTRGKLKQTILHIRVKIQPSVFIKELNKIYHKSISTIPLLSYILYKEDKFWYADYQFLV